jgi:hypothetical protein
MYSVFGDESQDETKQRVFAVSGIFGSREEWDTLADDWRQRTGGRVFHATDCDSDQGEFANIDHKENKKLYKDLITLLANTKMCGYTVTMDLTAYREFFPKAHDPHDPYYLGFHEVIVRFANMAFVSIPQDQVEFTFDIHFEREYNSAELYNYMRHLPEWEGEDLVAEKISFVTRGNPRIQAADLVAREGMKHMDNRIGPVRRPERLSMLALKKTKRFWFKELERDFFQGLIKRTNLLRDLPGADATKYRDWLESKGLTDNTSNRIQYQCHLDVQRLQRPAQDS